MKARSNRTGNIIDVNEQVLKQNPELFTPVEQPQQEAQPQGNMLQQAGKFGIDALSSMLAPFINTAKNVGGAALEASRASTIGGAADKSTDVINKLQQINAQLRVEKDPNRKKALLDQSRALSSGLSTLGQQATGAAEAQNPLLSNQDLGRLSTLQGGGEEVLRNTAGLASYGINPTGGGIMSQILKSGLQGGLMTASQKGTGMTDIAGGALLSGALGGVLGVGSKLWGKGAGKAVGASDDLVKELQSVADNTANKNIGQKIAGVGSSVREGILNPQVQKGAFYKFGVDEANQLQAGLKLRGSATSQIEQLGNQAKRVSEEVVKELGGTKTQILDKTLKQKYLEQADELFFAMDDKVRAKLDKKVFSEISKISQKGSAPAQAVYSLKKKFGDLLKKAFEKEAAGGTLKPEEEAYRAAFNAMKESLDSVNPRIKQLNTLENKMYELADGLIRTKKASGMKGDLLTGILRSEPVQGFSDMLGRGAMKVGGGVSGAMESPLGQLAGAGVNLAARAPGQIVNATIGQQPGVTPEAPQQQVVSPEVAAPQEPQVDQNQAKIAQLQKAMMWDLANNGGKQSTEIKAAMDMLKAQGGEKLTTDQRAAKNAGELIKDSLDFLPKVKNKIGVAGIGQLLNNPKAAMNIGDPDLMSFSAKVSNLRAMITKARAGTAVSEQEMKLLDKYTPSDTDSYQQLKTKLEELSKLDAFK